MSCLVPKGLNIKCLLSVGKRMESSLVKVLLRVDVNTMYGKVSKKKMVLAIKNKCSCCQHKKLPIFIARKHMQAYKRDLKT